MITETEKTVEHHTVSAVPLPYSGPNGSENYRSHTWRTVDRSEVRCGSCDSRPSHYASDYRCGEDPPTVIHTVYVWSDGSATETRWTAPEHWGLKKIHDVMDELRKEKFN